MLCVQRVELPVGEVSIAADETAVHAVMFAANRERLEKKLGVLTEAGNALTERTAGQLQEYMAGERQVFDLPVYWQGTPFQQQAWRALCEIPYGETRSYAEQAQRIGKPTAVRAIGRTNGLNPLAIIVPCHRVIAKSGKLTGYAGGLDVKRYLLTLEGAGSFT